MLRSTDLSWDGSSIFFSLSSLGMRDPSPKVSLFGHESGRACNNRTGGSHRVCQTVVPPLFLANLLSARALRLRRQAYQAQLLVREGLEADLEVNESWSKEANELAGLDYG
ncbi:hypothetical protein CRG98_018476 [Punica granatum]|uniref:Uncharacterized protein n=1 Tax=Punica granatum TaxID=22663 RepID=A0A2I0K0C7_PUNGR|nr:hypothetical protein CRG98_018476 [Punica granatum]